MKNTENDFINENYGLAISLARKFYSHGHNYDFEDIIQVALMSMIKAYRKIDKSSLLFLINQSNPHVVNAVKDFIKE